MLEARAVLAMLVKITISPARVAVLDQGMVRKSLLQVIFCSGFYLILSRSIRLK